MSLTRADFTDLVAVVTGGASGIGAATAELLVDRGARVAILDRDVAGVDSTAFTAVPCDVTSTAAVDGAIADVVSRLGGIDIVVNNAGIGAVGDVTENDEDEWHRVFDVNVVGIVRVTRAAHALPARLGTRGDRQHLLGRRHRRSATAGRVCGQQGRGRRPHSGHGRRPRRRRDPRQRGHPGNGGHPLGRTAPRAVRRSAAAAAEALRARQPMGRLVTADEVAYAIAYLASPTSASTTGTILSVDGGMSGLRLPR